MSIRFRDIGPACEQMDTRTGVAFAAHGKRSFTRRFQVVTTNNSYGPNEICQADNLPGPFERYTTPEGNDYDNTVVCVQLEAALKEECKEDNRYIWIVTATYSDETPPEGIPDLTLFGNDFTGSQVRPWEEPPLVKWESETIQRAWPNDLDGKAFLNSAKQPFTPAPTFEASRRVLVLTRNQQSFTPSLVAEYDWAVNSDRFFGYPPGTCQCYPISAEEDMRGNQRFYRVTYRVRFGTVTSYDTEGNPVMESFQPRVLDAGLCELQTSALFPNFQVPVPIMKLGFPISQPVLLNGSGRQLQPVLVAGVYVWDPVYIDFRVYPSAPFAPILTGGVG